MNIDANCRALQHLLVQGFTLYTTPAAVCIRRSVPNVLDGHSWAIVLDAASQAWLQHLPEEDVLRPLLVAAATGTSRVLCHLEGVYLDLDLEVDQVRHAHSRLEVAKNLSVEPPSLDGIMAIPEEVLQQELKRRKLQSGTGPDSGLKQPQS
jgi:hypothetical protein